MSNYISVAFSKFGTNVKDAVKAFVEFNKALDMIDKMEKERKEQVREQRYRKRYARGKK